MRSLFATPLHATAGTALAVGIFFGATSLAAAIPTDVATRSVRFADLDLANPDGRADLDARIRAAADAVCPTDGSHDLSAMQCRENAMAQANRDVADQIATRSANSTTNGAR